MLINVERETTNSPPVTAYVNPVHVIAVSEIHNRPDLADINFVGGGQMRVRMPEGGLEALALLLQLDR